MRAPQAGCWAGVAHVWVLPVGAAVTDANGVAHFTVKPAVSGSWRALVAAKPGVAGAGASASRWTTVVRSTTLSGVPTSPVRGHRYVLTGKVGPAQLGERVNVQTLRPGGAWRTVTYAFTDRYGVAHPGLTFTQGVTYVRLVAPGNASYATGVSGTATANTR